MANIIKLLNDITYLDDEELLDYFETFFDINNLEDYTYDSLANQKEKASTKKMFGSDDVFLRAERVLNEDPYCLEAFFVYFRLADDLSLYQYFDKMFNQIAKFNHLSKYKKYVYKQIVDNFVSFLMDINNITMAIDVELSIIKSLEICGEGEITRLAYLFGLKEDFDNLYNLYLQVGFFDETSYIALIVTALKNKEELKAMEIYNDFLSEYKYGGYIDHPWDLEKLEDSEALRMSEAMNACFELVRSVPYFINWCRENKKTSVKA